jgi:hypothetical protein
MGQVKTFQYMTKAAAPEKRGARRKLLLKRRAAKVISGKTFKKTGSSDAAQVIRIETSPVPAEEKHAEALLNEIATDGTDVSTLCETYGLKREDLGRLTGFSLRALADWAANKLPSQPAKRRLHEVRRLLDALSEVVKVKSIPQWLHKSNAAFDGMTPLQVIEVGEIDRLWAMVYDLESSDPN